MPRFLLGLFVFALAVYAVSDVIASTDQRRNNTPKFMWIIITLFIPIVGPLIWIVFSNMTRNVRPQSNIPPAQYSRRAKPMNGGPTAPDDDPDFLWKLAAEQRRKEAERKARTEEDTSKDEDSEDESDGDSSKR
ncbi:PLD nuclease N-terminal domain-containing protein [Populibacterium corticicola]|uniref:PLD nuclease N-terminal domain-containing protein n=1 Tax=Populibacterium corticicola TaxID=1812826 RepID=A0ABW5XFQ1_9MICO